MAAPYAHELHIASLAIQRASLLTKNVLSTLTPTTPISKPDSTPVTIADFAAQALLISAIHATFPSDSFVGEECADVLRSNASLCSKVWDLVRSTHLEDRECEQLLASPKDVEEMFTIIDLGGKGIGGRLGRVWMLDPIDGTATFLRGEQYAVSLALCVDGKQVVGVIGAPNLRLDDGRVREESVDRLGFGLMLSAVKGQGAWIREMGRGSLGVERRIERRTGGELHFVDYTPNGTWWHDGVRQAAERLGAKYPGTEVWSSHIRYVALIVGGGNAYVRIPVKRNTASYVWDHAGAQLIFSEAGGKVTDLEGKEIDFGAGRDLSNNWGMVAANEDVHAEILKVVREVLKENPERTVCS